MTAVNGEEHELRRICQLHRSQFHDHTPRQVMYAALEQVDTTVKRMFALVSEACDSTPESAKRASSSSSETAQPSRSHDQHDEKDMDTMTLQTKIKKLFTRMTKQFASNNSTTTTTTSTNNNNNSSKTVSAAQNSHSTSTQRTQTHDKSNHDQITRDPQAPFRRDESIQGSLHRRFARMLENLARAKEMMLLAISKIDEHLRQEEEIKELQHSLEQKRRQLHGVAEGKIQDKMKSFERQAKQQFYYQQEKAVSDSEFLKDKSNLKAIISFIDRIRATISKPTPLDADADTLDFHEQPVPEEGLLEKSTLLQHNLHETVNMHSSDSSVPPTSVFVPSFHAANADDVSRWFGTHVGHEWNHHLGNDTSRKTSDKKNGENERDSRKRKKARLQ